MKKPRKRGSKVKPKPQQLRRFSDSFKVRQVKKITEGLLTVRDVSRLYKVSLTSVYRWLYKYSNEHEKGIIQVVQMESEATKVKELEARLAAAERALGQKQMENDFLEQIIVEGSKALHVDLKKNFGTTPCKPWVKADQKPTR